MTSRRRISLATFLLFSFATIGVAYRSYAKETGQIPPQLPLAIEIALSKPFYVPAARGDRVTKVVIRVPLTDDRNPAGVSAIKLEPKMEGADKVRVDVYALSGPTSGIITCKGWDALKSMTIGSYVAGVDEDVALTKLAEFGIRMGDRPLTFRVVPKRILSPVPNPELEACECGSCAGLICCPNPGYCLGCGSCGSLCCSNTLAANSN